MDITWNQLDRDEKYDLLNILITEDNQVQVVIKKTECLKEGDILRFTKSRYEELIGVINGIEQYPAVTILLMEISPDIVTPDLKKNIKCYYKMEFFGTTST